MAVSLGNAAKWGEPDGAPDGARLGSLGGASQGPALHYRTLQDRIKRYIVEHDLTAGAALPPETHIARDLRVSRSSVREAVKALESLGILETRPGKGLYVRPFSLDPVLDNLAYSILFDRGSILELLEVRGYLEVGHLPRAIGALSPAQMEALRELVEQMRQKGARGESFPEEDRLFHRTLAEASGNRLLVKLLDVFWTVFMRLRDRSITVDPAPKHTWQMHARILDAAAAGDVGAAQAAMEASLLDVGERLQRARLRSGGGDEEPGAAAGD
jgi:DNA-binding FadR family transcriptional regulator